MYKSQIQWDRKQLVRTIGAILTLMVLELRSLTSTESISPIELAVDLTLKLPVDDDLSMEVSLELPLELSLELTMELMPLR
jgi:hypothetical protein